VSGVVHKPDRRLDDPKEVLLGFLDYYRSVIARKIGGLTGAELRESRLPSGWSPLGLVKHLVYMERRWLRWGFLAEQIPDPYGDQDQPGRWHAGPGDTAVDLIAALHAYPESRSGDTRAALAMSGKDSPPRRTPLRAGGGVRLEPAPDTICVFGFCSSVARRRRSRDRGRQNRWPARNRR